MKEELQRQAKEALEQGDYALAAKNWVQGHSLPYDENELSWIFKRVSTLNEAAPNPDLCAILGLIALDFNEIFNEDREEALIQCVQWSVLGITLDPEHYSCNRHAGSALYWLRDWESALKYYQKAVEILASPVLQIRIFNMLNAGVEQPDTSSLQIDVTTDQAMEVYNAGVELTYLTDRAIGNEEEYKRLTSLKRACYDRAYSLYRAAVIENNGDLLNANPEMFSLTCSNLSILLSDEKDYDGAIAITTEGMQVYPFISILQNRFGAEVDAGYTEEYITDGVRLIDDYGEQMDLETYFSTIDFICAGYVELKLYHEALEWVQVGFEVYYSIDPTDEIIQDEEIVRCFTNFYIYKAKAESALGVAPTLEESAENADQILEQVLDNPSVLISRANIWIDQGNFEKAMECYQYAIHFAAEKEMTRSLQVAFYNMGYLQVVHLKDDKAALDSFEHSIEIGNLDFWCFYWAVHCAYNVVNNEKTIQYAQSALDALAKQEGVTSDIIAEIYEHLGAAQMDLGQYNEAVGNLESALKYQESDVARENLKIATAHANSSQSFFKKFFRK
ncbi:tetratricopeptide repeat protein [Flavobacterium sp. HSC-61S13]|uniref:tetratricopeptide repeat protein n=1 Tax=Flavobacterium sp. HSC-61S13 TaxID=2910963 RepID=UPI0020A133D4|nr:hypothetical protein [Flavobacterium sp. HSC-61S13]MCP1996286.1 tetratricopeptide (TPR) repeat protein [Flavobacterium sp. HSC-61S13]